MSATPITDREELSFRNTFGKFRERAFNKLMAKMREFEVELVLRDRTITALRERNAAMEKSRDDTRSQLADLQSEIQTIYLEGWDDHETSLISEPGFGPCWDGSRSSRLMHGKEAPVRRCGGCHNQIDPDCCCCGSSRTHHDPMELGHSFVPMGCNCGREKQ